MLRRLLYFQQILHQETENTLLYKFFKAQLENPTRNDWVTQILKDLEILDIREQITEIGQMSQEEFSEMCKEKVYQNAFQYLENKKNKSDKRRHIKYKHLEMAKYLQENKFGHSVKERQFLFHCRANDIDVKANRTWKYSDTNCISCPNTNTAESQIHILRCEPLLRHNDKITYLPTYEDLFSDDIQDQIYTSNIICENMRIREDLQLRAHVN